MARATMEALGRRMRQYLDDRVAGARAAAEAHRRFMAGEKGGCATWATWVQKYAGGQQASISYMLIQAGSAADPLAAMAEFRKHKNELDRKARKARPPGGKKPQDIRATFDEVRRSLGPQPDRREDPGDLERQVSNLMTCWNNCGSAARARFLAMLKLHLQPVTDAA